MKKVPVDMKITTSDAAANLAGLPLLATVAMADVAAAMREGLLAFSTAAGLVVMQQMLTAELAGIVGDKHAKLGPDRVGNWHGTTRGQVVLGRARSASSVRVAVTSMATRSSWIRGRRSPTRTCCVRSWSSGCSPVSPRVVMSKSPNRSARRGRRYRNRRCHAVSSPRPRPR